MWCASYAFYAALHETGGVEKARDESTVEKGRERAGESERALWSARQRVCNKETDGYTHSDLYRYVFFLFAVGKIFAERFFLKSFQSPAHVTRRVFWFISARNHSVGFDLGQVRAAQRRGDTAGKAPGLLRICSCSDAFSLYRSALVAGRAPENRRRMSPCMLDNGFLCSDALTGTLSPVRRFLCASNSVPMLLR